MIYPGAEKKTLMGHIKGKQENFFIKDSHKFLKLLESKKKSDDQFVSSVNRKLLHIEKMRPIVKATDR